MSRLWSRFGIRTLSVALLLVAVVGGLALSRDRNAPDREDLTATTAGAADDERQLSERAASRASATSRQRAAQREAAEKAADAAKAAAQRARRVDDAATRKKEEEEEKEKKESGTVPFTGPIPSSCNEYSGNRAIGCALVMDRGLDLQQMACLDKLWSKESGWNHRARNNSSGAYGIPQALPGNKMSSAGADWENNPATQIKWGLGYIKDRYGTPCGAWSHSQETGWY